MKRIFSLLILVWLLSACGVGRPPISFSPNQETITQALILQLQQTQNKLSDSLNLNVPEFSVSKIKVNSITPSYVDKLATYHLTGTYNLKLQQSNKSTLQKNNPFELFLQRQIEGKTWRLLRKNDDQEEQQKDTWSSYLVIKPRH